MLRFENMDVNIKGISRECKEELPDIIQAAIYH
jgi:hypothetical protein